jgi:phosphohistidine phosphatase SixA
MTLPLPDGSFQRYRISESPVMSPALAAKFPEIRSFRGQGIDDPTASVRLDLSPSGLHAQIISGSGTIIIDPFGAENQYASFNKRANRATSRPFECLVQGRPNALAVAAAGRAPRSGQHLRTYRLALACTGEYTARFGGTTAGALAAINTTVNRVTGIYEREASIRLMLVDNNDEIIFTNAQADPFDNHNPNVLIDQSQSVIDRLIGNANYDIGHTVCTGDGGLAGLGVVCRAGQKARGITGRPDPFGDPFDVDYVAHEMGHQFDGDHTFNGSFGSCGGGNRNGSTAFEPGSGSTIQAYAGICGADNLQANSDPYFHSISLDQIIAYTTTGGGNVPTPVPSGNGIPAVDGGPDINVPMKTPFKLTATGTDPDGDALLYCWEERDLGPVAALGQRDDGRIPLFRSFSPATGSVRTFPQWSDILNHSETPGEQLATQARRMNFRVTVRDGRGGISGDDVSVQIVASAGPFQVTSPASASLPSNLLQVTWDVANTDRSPVNSHFVHIILSTDGGNSFSFPLASTTPNDGTELVVLPNTAGPSLRTMVESADNSFFAVSPTNFQIQPSRARIFVVRHAEKQAGAEPDLSETGQLRAQTLARLLTINPIHAVFSTDVRRARQTAEPTALAAGIPITPYTDTGSLVHQLQSLQQGEQVLVVGHSNTIGPIVNQLGVSQQINVGEDEFDNLFVVSLTDSSPSFERFKYAPDAPVHTNGGDRVVVEPSPRTLSPPRLDAAEHTSNLHTFQRPSFSAASATGIPPHRFAQSDLPVAYLDQNWTPAESVEFYGIRQGSPIMRKAFFDALEQPDCTDLFRDSVYLARFGFLPQTRHAGNPDGYPVGFVGTTAIEIACAACHTSRITYAGTEYRIDGGQAMTDVETWLAELIRALRLTLADAPSAEELEHVPPGMRIQLDQNTKFGRFAARILETEAPRASQVYALRQLLAQDYERRQRYNDYNDFGQRFRSDAERANATKHEPYGFGRLDALGAILNQACAEALKIDANASPANAPVSYPAIWDAPQHTHVQWNGAVDNTAIFGPLGRNVGQVVGVFGLVDVEGGTLIGYDSSVRFDSLDRAEELVAQLWSPLWPTAFGRDESLVSQGRAVYQQHCISCHALMQRDDPNRQTHDVLISINDPHGPYPPLLTDPLTAKNWNDRQARVGPLAGRFETRPLGKRFPGDPQQSVFGRDILSHVVFNLIARSFVPWRDELTLDTAPRRAMFATADATTQLLRYKARPLNGVWSTAPYLHNGSVLNMVELLKAPHDRKTRFRIGTSEYDPQTMGFRDAGPFEFDTARPGNSNAGHRYGIDLPSDDKAALLEFLKTL